MSARESRSSGSTRFRPGLPGLQGAVWRWWEGPRGLLGHALSAFTLPLELLFRLGVAIRNAAYRLGVLPSSPAPIPVVSVGNLAVGGTGKTPLAGWIAARLAEAGAAPALVARGYGTDELELHRRWNPGVPVLAAPGRLRAVRDAADRGAGIAVLDDGFQHRRLARELDLVLVAAEHPLPPRLLPRGPYREPLRSLRRADLVIVTRRIADQDAANRVEAAVRKAAPDTPVARVRLVPRDWTDLDGAPADPPSGPLLAVASVARPRDFARMVRAEAPGNPELLALPDHHEYTPGDADEIAHRTGGRTVVTTEKDAVKLAAFRDRLGPVRVLRLRVEFEGGGEEEIRRALASLPGEGS